MAFCIAALQLTGCLAWTDFEPKTAGSDASMTGDDAGTLMPGDWWDPEWVERRLIEVPRSASSEVFEHFPLRVPLVYDGPIRFVTPTGQLLPHQRDEDGFWVRTTIAADTPTSFYAYTGNDGGTLGDSSDVWSNSYAAVFRFEEELIDEDNGFQPYFLDEIAGLTVRQVEEFTQSGHANGQFGRTLHLTDEFETRFVSPDLHTVIPQGAMTLELWFTIVPFLGTVRNVMSQPDGLAIEMREPGIVVTARGEQQEPSAGWEVNSDVWTKMTVVIDEVSPRRTIRFYLDDQDPRESPPLPENWRPAASEFVFGAPSTLDFRYDELRVSTVARSDAWIRFAARIEGDPTMVTVGEIELAD